MQMQAVHLQFMSKKEIREVTQNDLSDFVNREVYLGQSMLINELLKKGIFDYEDIENLTMTDEELKDRGYITTEDIEKARDNGEDQQEIYEWYACSEWLIEKLSAKNEPILKTDFGEWWGRTCTGQAIFLDRIVKDIYNELHDGGAE